MITEYVKVNVGVMRLGCHEQITDPLLVHPQFQRHLGRIVPYLMKESIKPRPVKKSKVDPLPFDLLAERAKILMLGPVRITHEIGNLSFFEEVENVGAAIHSLGLKRAFLF